MRAAVVMPYSMHLALIHMKYYGCMVSKNYVLHLSVQCGAISQKLHHLPYEVQHLYFYGKVIFSTLKVMESFFKHPITFKYMDELHSLVLMISFLSMRLAFLQATLKK